MKPALCESGLLKSLLDNIGGPKTVEWHEILRRALRRENPFLDQSITFAIRLTPSMIAGIRALKELHSQGRIPTTHWHDLEVEPIDNNGGYSDAYRTMTFTLENKQRVKVKASTTKKQLQQDIVRSDEGRKWESHCVWIERKDRMLFFVGYTRMDGSKPWQKWPKGDEPLPGVTWRAPIRTEIAAYNVAIRDEDERAFRKIYYSDLIDWTELNDNLGRDTGWVERTLEKVA